MIKKLSDRFRHIVTCLDIKDQYLKSYLQGQVEQFPETGKMMRTLQRRASPSEMFRKLRAIVRNPQLFLGRIFGSGVSEKDANRFLDSDPVAPLILFQYATQKSPARPERHLGQEGDIVSLLLQEVDRDSAIRQAALDTIQILKPHAGHGRGGNRHKRDIALALAAEHVLEIYRVVARKMPTVTVVPAVKGPEVQIQGIAVEFLDCGLEMMGFKPSRATLRRLIDDYNGSAKQRPSRQSH